ncbi:MAG: carbohydrate binding domain-containing protein [Thermoguttaceae bacterium]
MRCHVARLIVFALLSASANAATLEHRWVYLATNLLVDKNVDEAISLADRAAKAGYNGIVLTDSKFLRWDDLPKQYVANVRRLREALRRRKLAAIACVCPIGYSNELLSRDPNLAEGLPVVDAPFIARGGKLLADDDSVRVVNGGFEQSRKNVPSGWNFVDQPGKISMIDTAVHFEGRASLRMKDIDKYDPQNGHGRACQTIAVKPFRYYHVSVAVKTQDFQSAGDVQIVVLTPDGTSLNYFKPRVEKTQDWKRIDVTFNSLEATKVDLYLGIWGARGGTVWWDDLRVEPAGLVNVVRRAGAPLKVASADGSTIYAEGRDFQNASDPKLGMLPWPGAFEAWHEPPQPIVPEGSRIQEGQELRLSYYHTALIYEEQAMCCMAEPKVGKILAWQIAQVHKYLEPDGYFLQHDEIRLQGWDESCRKSNLSPGELLAENVRKCTSLVRHEDPGRPIYVWSDMFDPYHNARKTARYYLVKGDGPWYGSWKGLDKEVTIINWNSQPAERVASLRHFAALGNRQILAGYYDGPVDSITAWLGDAGDNSGVDGAMYTTWAHRYDDLEAFARKLKQ